MGHSFFIACEQAPEHSLSCDVPGKCLSAASEVLDLRTELLGVIPLTSFWSKSLEEHYDLMGVPEACFDEETGTYDREAVEQWRREELGAYYEPLPEGDPEVWFEPEEGLVTVRALLNSLRTDATAVPDAEGTLADLEACERVLEELNQQGIRWHLASDF